MNPPPPGPVSGLSTTQDANAAAMHASTALPPSSSTEAPASAVSGCPAAIAPRTGLAYGVAVLAGTALERRADEAHGRLLEHERETTAVCGPERRHPIWGTRDAHLTADDLPVARVVHAQPVRSSRPGPSGDSLVTERDDPRRRRAGQ